MEAIQTVFRDVREKHTDNTQIQQILSELQDKMGHVLTEHLNVNTTRDKQGAAHCPDTQKMKHYAHHCLRPEVINNLSHKVKTPLTAIISGIQLLYNYDHDECVLRIMDYLMQSSIELTQFVNDIMDLYYITQDKFDIEYEPVNLTKLVEYVYSVYALQMQEENINFHYDIAKQIPETIITDKKRLTQILINLFSNAIKSFDYEQNNKQIFITFKAITSTRLQINIRDSGRGVDLKRAETLFDPFYKTDNTEGIGLGLTICRLLIKKIGSGNIQFVKPTNPDFSTELVAEFDIKQEPRQLQRPAILTRNIQDPVLVIVDDNTTNLDLLKIIIKNIIDKNGYTLTIKPFNDPYAAKSFILANMIKIIMCMVDMKMPKLTGTELIRDIYANEISKGVIPFSIIILSALTRNYIAESISSLPDQLKHNIIVSSKPYNMQEIEKNIVSALKAKLCRATLV